MGRKRAEVVRRWSTCGATRAGSKAAMVGDAFACVIQMRGPTWSDATPDLFGDPAVRAWPDGFRYQPDLITVSEEAALLDQIHDLDFHAVEMRGVVARRRVIQYGWK